MCGGLDALGRFGGFVGLCGVGTDGNAGRIGGILLTSLTVRSPKYCSSLSFTTATSLCKSIRTSYDVSLRHDTISSSPLSVTVVSVLTNILYAICLLRLACGDKCALAIMGDRCVVIMVNNCLLSNKSGASITSLLSSSSTILLYLFRSITPLKYPNARFTVVRQLSCSCFHPCSPPGSCTLLRYIQRVLSSSVCNWVCLVVCIFHTAVFVGSFTCLGPCGNRCGCIGPGCICYVRFGGAFCCMVVVFNMFGVTLVTVIGVYFICLLTISLALAIVLATALANMLFSDSFSSTIVSTLFLTPRSGSSAFDVFCPAGYSVGCILCGLVCYGLGCGIAGPGVGAWSGDV